MLLDQVSIVAVIVFTGKNISGADFLVGLHDTDNLELLLGPSWPLLISLIA
jgi:hypothetical protein